MTGLHHKRSYRAQGRDHLARAQALLATGRQDELIYAVLELRMAIESHVYATAEAYSDELPEPKLAKWQPPGLLRELLTIDPHVDTTGTISFAREIAPGIAGTDWKTLGTDKKMTLKEVEAAYHKLGNFLHIETVLDRADGKIRDYARLRKIGGEIAERLADIFSGTIHNFKMGVTAQMACFVCHKTIKRRLTNLKPGDGIVTECGPGCHATYSIMLNEGNKVEWTARFDEIPCAQEGCIGTVQIWEKHMKLGNSFLCDCCGKASELALGIQAVLDADEPPATVAG